MCPNVAYCSQSHGSAEFCFPRSKSAMGRNTVLTRLYLVSITVSNSYPRASLECVVYMSVVYYSLQTCLDIIQASADPSASLPRAKRSLPRISAAHVFHCLLPQTFRGAWFATFASASIGAERKVFLSKVAFRRSLSRLRLHWATHATWPLASNTGPPFRGASAKLPRNTPAVLVFLACCFSSKRCASCTRQHLFSSTVIVSPCFSMHALKHVISYQPQSLREAFRMLPRVWRGAHFQQ